MIRVALVILVLMGSALGQALTEGAVVGLQVEPNPVNSTFVYDFELCCGIPQGPGGFLGNGFSYAQGKFSAFYKYPGQQNGWSFSGSIDRWLTSQTISKYCTVQNGTLKNGVIVTPEKISVTGLAAEYSQMFCQRDGVYWSGPGGLSVHSP